MLFNYIIYVVQRQDNFKSRLTDNTFTMNESKQLSLKAKRNAAIYKDYCAMFKKGLRVEVISKKLSDKYFIREGSIYRVILKERGLLDTVRSRSVP